MGTVRKEKKGSRIAGILLVLAFFFFFAGSAFADEVQTEGTVIESVAHADPVVAKKSWFQRLFYKPTLNEVLAESSTPKALCRAVARHVGYRTESTDHWSPAADTWENGRGDCEDFAILIQDLCRQSDISADVVLYFSIKGGEGHAVVAGSWEGKSWMSSVGSYEVFDSQEKMDRRVAGILGCRADDLWSFRLSASEMTDYIAQKNTQPEMAGAFSTASAL